MSPVQVIPDGEKVFGGYLRTHPDITALGARIVGQTPKTTTDPWVRLTQLDATSVRSLERLIVYMVQLDCYAGKAGVDGSQQAQASLIVRTVRAALHAMPDTALDGMVVTSVRFIGMPRIPDSDFEPARERYVLTALIHAHPRS